MAGFFKFLLYLGVAMALLAFLMPMFADQPWTTALPADSKRILSFGGLALIVIALVGRSFTRREEVEWK